MCGIVYKSNFYTDTNIDDFINACNLLNNRGPDDSGYLFTSSHSFGHKRLAVRDIKNGKQPMSILNHHLIYNGEIYNTDFLSDKLKKKNVDLEFSSDTLLLLKLLINYNSKCLKDLNGIFSFVYTFDDEVMIVRDMFGVKPLFYSFIDKDIIVASEIKSILAYKKRCVVDKDGLCELLGMGPSHSVGKTIYKDIYEVKPGHYLTFSKTKGLKDHKYYELKPKEFNLSYEDTVKKVKDLLDEAIKRQSVSDVGISSFLSGGLDSSIISTVLKSNVDCLDTYSIDYEDNISDFIPNSFEISSDRDFTKLVSADINSIQHDVVISNEKLVDGLKKCVILRDGPGMTDIDSSMYYLASNISKKHKVGMSGECADEIFGGYPWFYKKEKYEGFPWIRNIKWKESMLNENIRYKLNLKKYITNEYLKAINSVPVLKTDSLKTIKERQMFYINLRYFMQNLLDRKDRMTMGTSLEVRVPFCDKELVEFMYNVPFSYKYKDNIEKKLLRDAYSKVVIDEVIKRKKSPYPKSNSKVYHKMVVSLLEDVLKDKNSILYVLFDIKKVKKLMESDSELDVPWYGQLMRKTAFLAYLYQIDYWSKEYKIEIEGDLWKA